MHIFLSKNKYLYPINTDQCLVIQKVLVTPLTRFSRLVKSFVNIQECYMITLRYNTNTRVKSIGMKKQPKENIIKMRTSDNLHKNVEHTRKEALKKK
jgi:uncharacterized protein (UPF0262 family)